jgi:hypothetical protein
LQEIEGIAPLQIEDRLARLPGASGSSG